MTSRPHRPILRFLWALGVLLAVLVLPAAARAASASADVQITATDSPDPVEAGAQITYQFTIHNAGPDAASNVVFTDDVPSGTSFSSISSDFVVKCTDPGINFLGTVSCKLTTLGSGGDWHLTLIVTVNRTGAVSPIVNSTASVTSGTFDPNGTNNAPSPAPSTTISGTAAANVVFNPAPTDTPDPVEQGGQITYQFTVENNGSDPAANVVFTDNVPSGTSFTSISSDFVVKCTDPGLGFLGTVTCQNPTLGVAQSWHLTLIVTVNRTGAVSPIVNNTAALTSPSDGALPGPPSVSTTISGTATADVVFSSATDSPDPVKPGAQITYQFTVTNNGPDQAGNVVFTDDVPSGTSFTSISSDFVVKCTDPGLGFLGTVTCQNPSLGVGAGNSWHLTLVVAVNKASPPSVVTNNTGSLTSPSDGAPGNNSAGTITTTVEVPTTAVAVRSVSARAGPAGVVVRWRTGSELGVLGYHVYRIAGERSVRATPALIASRGGPSASSYRFLDRAAPQGKRLAYGIQAVHLDGTRSWAVRTVVARR